MEWNVVEWSGMEWNEWNEWNEWSEWNVVERMECSGTHGM